MGGGHDYGIMQVVDMLVSQRTSRERELVLKTALAGGGGPDNMVPGVSSDDLGNALSELITGMERMETIPDWGLLMVRIYAPDAPLSGRRFLFLVCRHVNSTFDSKHGC